MKIGIDGRWMAPPLRGMGKFATEFVYPIRDHVIPITPAGVSPGTETGIQSGLNFSPWWEQVDLPRICKAHNLDYLVCPYNTAPLFGLGNTKIILVVHDLIFSRSFKELPLSVSGYQNLGRLYRRALIRQVLSKAHRIVTVSDFTRGEILSMAGNRISSVSILPNSIDSSWITENPLSLEKRSQYILTVGGHAPSKNIRKWIKSFALIANRPMLKDTVLRIVGISKEYRQSLSHLASQLNIGPRVAFENYVPEDELKMLYRSARCVVFPSLYEGFGIPIIEAFSSGTPLACSNTTSMKEIAGDAAWLFDPTDENSMATAVERMLNSPEKMKKKIHEGLKITGLYEGLTVRTRIREFWEALL